MYIQVTVLTLSMRKVLSYGIDIMIKCDGSKINIDFAGFIIKGF